MTRRRYEPRKRYNLILKAAVRVAKKPGGWAALTREAIAREAGCSEALVSVYLGNMPAVRKAVMGEAVRRDLNEIIAQSIVAHDGYAVKNKALRQRALASLLG